MTAVTWASGCAPSKSGTGWLCTKAKLTGTAWTWKACRIVGLASTSTVTSLEATRVAAGHRAERRDEVSRLLQPR